MLRADSFCFVPARVHAADVAARVRGQRCARRPASGAAGEAPAPGRRRPGQRCFAPADAERACRRGWPGPRPVDKAVECRRLYQWSSSGRRGSSLLARWQRAFPYVAIVPGPASVTQSAAPAGRPLVLRVAAARSAASSGCRRWQTQPFLAQRLSSERRNLGDAERIFGACMVLSALDSPSWPSAEARIDAGEEFLSAEIAAQSAARARPHPRRPSPGRPALNPRPSRRSLATYY